MSERIDVRAALGRMLIRAAFGRLRDNDISPQQMSEENQADLRAIAAVDELVEVLTAAAVAAEKVDVLLAKSDKLDGERLMGRFANNHWPAIRRALARIAPNELHDKAAELRGRGE